MPLDLSRQHQSMRGYFAYALYEEIEKNPDVVLVTGDLGYKVFDYIKQDFPEQFINTGAAELSACGIATGLAYQGKLPIFYSITTFLLFRPFEVIRNYINAENVPVLLVGSGRDKDYAHDGLSHWSEDDKLVMQFFPHIESHWPETKEEVPSLLQSYIQNPRPMYINLRR